jgi:aldehyde:ferredoxin oxidoreductase
MSRTGAGRVLEVDLGTGAARSLMVREQTRRRLGGGGALATWLLLHRTPAGLNPQDASAAVVLAGGAVAGAEHIGLSRCSVVAKSRLTGGIVDSIVEGPFAHGLSGVDLDALVVVGRAAAWSVLVVDADHVEIRPAGDLVGQTTDAVVDRLRAEYGATAHVAAVGPAGVAGLGIASLVLDGGFPTRSGGLGAVVAAKRLLAVVLAGGAPGAVRPAVDETTARAVTRKYVEAMAANPLATTQLDPPGFGFWPAPGLEGYLETENYRASTAGVPIAAADAAGSWVPVLDGACPGCPQRCLKAFGAGGSGAAAGVIHQQAIPAFTATLGLDDHDVAATANRRCHELGVEQVELSAALAAILDARADGIDPTPMPGRFGDIFLVAAIDGAVDGDPAYICLRDGVAALARRWPALAPYTLHVRGIAVPPFDPRGSYGLALGYALNPSGPRYDAFEHDIDFDDAWGDPRFIDRAGAYGVPAGGWSMSAGGPDKARATARLWQLWSGYDALGVCVFAAPPTRPLTEDDAAELVAAITGWSLDPDEVLAIGTGRLALQRRYNLREGVGSHAATLPNRFFEQPVVGGRLDGVVLDREQFAADLAVMREALGWTWPSASTR